MNPRADRGNRAVLIVIGLLLTAAGGLGLALSYGAFGDGRARQPVLTPATRDFVHRNHGWFWLAVAAAAVVLGLLALRWLLTQTGTDRVRQLPLEPDTRAGSTTLAANALTAAVSGEIESYHGVRQAGARLLHDPRRPDLILSVAVNDRADLAALRRRIEEEAITHARHAVGRDVLPVRLQLRLAPSPDRQLR